MIIKYIISIHAPLTGSDLEIVYASQIADISIHAPLTGSDIAAPLDIASPWRFQSTLPSQGATYIRITTLYLQNISIHAPLTGSDAPCGTEIHYTVDISIHAPLTGSDDNAIDLVCDKKIFQSTLPSQGATYDAGNYGRLNAFQSTPPSQGATRRAVGI